MSDAVLSDIVVELRAARRERGLPLRVVSERMGFPAALTQVCAWELGNATPTLKSLESWAAALGFVLTLTRVPDAADVRPCIECRSPITSTLRKEYCSDGCRSKAHNRRCRARRGAGVDELTKAHIRAVACLYGRDAARIVYILDLNDDAAIEYTRAYCARRNVRIAA